MGFGRSLTFGGGELSHEARISYNVAFSSAKARSDDTICGVDSPFEKQDVVINGVLSPRASSPPSIRLVLNQAGAAGGKWRPGCWRLAVTARGGGLKTATNGGAARRGVSTCREAS